jgi:hypothetical protein
VLGALNEARSATKREVTTVNKSTSKQPLSAMAYAAIALVGLFFTLGFTFFYVKQVPKLVEGGVQGQVFYLLLIPWALSSAAFLFGAMRSYAHFTQRHLGSFLELGGPVVLFCLVLLGGFKLVPPAPETFDLAVRAHSADTALVTSGQITLELPGLPHLGSCPPQSLCSVKATILFRPLPSLSRTATFFVAAEDLARDN